MVDTWRVLFDTCEYYHCFDGLRSRRSVLGTKLNTQQLTAYCGGTAPGQVVGSRGSGRLGDVQEQRGWAADSIRRHP